MMTVFSDFLPRTSRMTLPSAAPKFRYGDLVEKTTGDYTGPGIIRGLAVLGDGRLRYLVGHQLANGKGELLHTYSEINLRPR